MINLRLKELRQKNNLTLDKLSKMLNVGNSTLSQYENGKREPSFDILLKMSEIFNVSIDYLLGKENSTYQKEEQPTPPKKNTIVFFGRGEGKKEFEVSDEEMEAWMKIFENRDKYKNHNDGNF